MPRTRLLAPALATGLALGACREPNENHCASKGGDAYCQEKTGLAAGAVFCTNNCGGEYDDDGCLVAEQPPADGCWLCDGAGSENCDGMAEASGSESASETESSGSETATETSETSSTTEGPECMDSSMCGGQTPLCEDGACVSCGEGATTSCASEYPDTPACDAGTGTCVECTSEDAAACGGMTPVCEGFMCVGCDEHAQCPASACNMSTGACMPEDRVWWVNQDAADGGDGSEAMPFDSFADALALIGAGQLGTINFATPDAHSEKVDVFEEVGVAIIGKSAGRVEFGGAATITANQGALLMMEGMRVSGGGNIGLVCSSCSAWLSRTEVTDNDDGGIDVQGMANLSIKNSTVGGFLLSAPAMSIASTSSVSILYSTVVGGANGSTAITCQAGASVDVRNSLLASANANPEVSCPSLAISNSASETGIMGTVALGQMPGDGAWFADFAAGDLLLSDLAPAGIATAATWHTGDPTTDIDDTPRPNIDGTSDFAGADIRE